MKFDKLVAAGNDFLLFNGIEKHIEDYSKLALNTCNRHFGIGADGIMVCEESSIADIKMIYYNSDGSQGEMCGNGIRCFAKYIYDYGIVNKSSISVETLAGIKYVDIQVNNFNKAEKIKVDMGYPIFEAEKIPMNLNKNRVVNEKINIDSKEYEYSALLVGVPHVVIFVEDIKKIDINYIGKKIENHPIFPRKTNVNFIEINNRKNINIYTWERGAGRTLGCGTGSCASVVIGNILNKLDNTVEVITEGGNITVELDENFKIYMLGDANHIASGILQIS
jgi:diaminopimelate epimerase